MLDQSGLVTRRHASPENQGYVSFSGVCVYPELYQNQCAVLHLRGLSAQNKMINKIICGRVTGRE